MLYSVLQNVSLVKEYVCYVLQFFGRFDACFNK